RPNHGSGDHFFEIVRGIGAVASTPQSVTADQVAGRSREDDQRVVQQLLLRELRHYCADFGIERRDGRGGPPEAGQQVSAEYLLVAGDVGGGRNLLHIVEARRRVAIQKLLAAGIRWRETGEREREEEGLRGGLRINELDGRGRAVRGLSRI